MIQMPQGWTQDEERRIRDVLHRRRLPDFFRSYSIEFGQDWAGDPAVTVWLLPDVTRAGWPDEVEAVHRFLHDLRQELVELGLSHWPYVRLGAGLSSATAP
jgi:hypothetical protein